jgi:ATP/ADP translocase
MVGGRGGSIGCVYRQTMILVIFPTASVEKMHALVIAFRLVIQRAVPTAIACSPVQEGQHSR